MDIEAVVFDVDGTLYPNYVMYMHSIGFGLRKPLLLRHFSATRRSIRYIRPIQNFRIVQAELLAARMRIPADHAYSLINTWIYDHWERSLHRIRPYPHVRTVLSNLRKSGLKLGIISDYPVERKLVYLDLGVTWDCAFSSEETGYLKPNPEPFLEAARRLNLPPEKILYVGNSYEYDVLGAKSVGMATAHRSLKQRPDSEADITFSDFRELLNLNLAGALR